MDERLLAIATALATLPETVAVTQSGSGFPKPDEGDIDLFIYADALPSSESRRAALKAVRAEKTVIDLFDSGIWGHGDQLVIDGVEIYVMWFTVENAQAEARRILSGELMEKFEGVLYPTGRLATILKLKVLWERRDFVRRLQDEVRVYPEALAKMTYDHFNGRLYDTETFERAVFRKEVLLYHQALEWGLDWFLQALFALNRTYFPSRKRTLQSLAAFQHVPEGCAERLLKVVKLGADAETLADSFAEWQKLVDELRALADR